MESKAVPLLERLHDEGEAEHPQRGCWSLGWSLSLKESPVIRNSTSKRDLQLEQLQTLHTAFLDAEEGDAGARVPIQQSVAVNGWPCR